MLKTKIVKIETGKIDKRLIKEAAHIIKKGGLVIYPTETCYGIGGNATNVKVIDDIYEIKNRPRTKPIPIIVSDLRMMNKYGIITDRVRILMKSFMPGPLTIVVRKRKTIPDSLNSKEIAFRISSHPVASVLAKEVNLPITSTSANLYNEQPLYRTEDVIKTFDKKVDMILDYGSLPRIKPSTLIDMKTNEPKLIREGPIPIKIIIDELKNQTGS